MSAGAYGLSRADLPRPWRPEPVRRGSATYRRCVQLAAYSLTRVDLPAGGVEQSHFFLRRRGCYWVESGEVTLSLLGQDGQPGYQRGGPGTVFEVRPGEVHAFRARSAAVIYFFASGCAEDDCRWVGPREGDGTGAADAPATTVTATAMETREKYWGAITTIRSEEYASKRIRMNAGGQSSLEFHCFKHETYYVQSGRVEVGMRVGRAENCSLVLETGECLSVGPGLMHMRIAIEDTVIQEISTRDDDADSHLVEDGRSYHHQVV